jgi:hypothetical protein
MKRFFCHRRLALVLFLVSVPMACASNTWYVNGVHGNDNNSCKSPQLPCKTIGHAISLAFSGDSILIAAATYPENLIIDVSLSIVGSGPHITTIDGGGANTVLTIPNSGTTVTLSNVAVINGHSVDGGGIYNSGTLTVWNSIISGNSLGSCILTYCHGAGIYNSGTLRINDSTVSGNVIAIQGTGAALGAGVYSKGDLTIQKSTFSGNRASVVGESARAEGGALSNEGGTLTINNSTFSGNVASGTLPLGWSGGGAIYNSDGRLTISSSTLSGNSAYYGGGIYINGVTTLQNTIVTSSPAGGNCSGTVFSNGYNLSSDDTCDFKSTGDLNDTHPKLGPLKNNGGPSKTRAELLGSPTIDAGNPSGCTDSQGHLLKTDQRGDPRPGKYKHDKRCDMGAFERQSD